MYLFEKILVIIYSFSINYSRADVAANMNQFMPNPSGHGFGDTGMTKQASFEENAQMARFGIPNLINPVTSELTDLDFEYAMEGDKYLAVMFYSHKMKDYKSYALHWEKASMEMKESIKVYTSANITMSRLDISVPEHADLVKQFEISQDKPTLKLFYSGKLLTDINCPVIHNELRQFIIAQTIPAVMEIDEQSSLNKWKRRKQVNQANLKFLAYFTKDTKDAEDQFHIISQKLRSKIQFAQVTDKSLFLLATKLNDAKPGSIMFIRDFNEPKQILYDGALTLPELISFVRLQNMPLLTSMGDKDEYRVREFLQHPFEYRLLFFFKDEKSFTLLKPNLESLAKDIRSNCLIAYTIADGEDGTNFDYSFWGISSKDPSFLYLQIHKDRKFIYSGKDAHDINVINKFLDDVKNNKIKPKLKSGIVPVNNDGPVRVVTTNTYSEEIYGKKNEDSLVLFYNKGQPESEWYLDQMAKFSKVWRRERRIRIFSVDCRDNDIMDVELPHLPILFHVSSKDKSNRVFSTSNSISTKYPDMQKLMEFTKNSSHFDLKLDEKVWKRVLSDDDKLKQEMKNTMNQNSEDIIVQSEIKEEIKITNNSEQEKPKNLEELKKLISDEQIKHKEKLSSEKEKAKEKKTTKVASGKSFPSSFQKFGESQNILGNELKDLLKSTGLELPKKIDVSSAQRSLFSTLYFLLNFGIVSIFGDGFSGAAYLLFFLITCFILLPMTWNIYKKYKMKKWLNEFYQIHSPDQIPKIPNIINSYSKLSNGMKKLEEDLVRKYIINNKVIDTKKK